MSKRTKWLLAIGVIAALVVGQQVVAFATVTTDAGFQGGDGDLAPTGGLLDWNSFDPVTWTGTAPLRTADKVDATGWHFVGKEDAQATTSDTGFAGGTKQDKNCASVIGSKAPNKDDLKRAYLSTKIVNGKTFLNLAWIRIPQNTTSPSAHIGFEFNQGKESCGSSGLVSRTAGDLLIVYDFEGSATDNPTITLRKWVTSGTCEVGSSSPPCWGPSQNLTAQGFAEAKVNTSVVGQVTDALAPPQTGTTSVDETLGLNEFGEAGINLSAALPDVFGPGTCNTFGKAEVVSCSSGNSTQAAMEDLVGPVNFSLSNCGTIIIKKHTNPADLDQNFSFTSNLSGSQLSCSQTGGSETPTSFTLNDAGAGDTAPNTQTCTNVPAGSYTVTEGADPTGFKFASLSCTPSTGDSKGTQDTTNPKQANITISGGGTVTCTFVNDQQLGAIKITKISSKPSADPLSEAKFSVTGPNGFSKELTTGSDGTVCEDNLAFGSYAIKETAAPSGYDIDDSTTHNVTVDTNAKCSDASGQLVLSFKDTPLTDILAKATSQAAGGTKKSQITCKDSNDANIGNSPQPASGFADPVQVDAKNLKPGTYTCTIEIDP